MSIVDEEFEKLLYSVERFKKDIKSGNKRAAKGDMDFIQDRAKGIVCLLLAQLDEEMKVSNESDSQKQEIKDDLKSYYEGIDRERLFNQKNAPE
ncbi:hypothetical protein QTG56_22535 (plasmid) [Rossellomorea sp. AcN35-11]|nr:hypothetical protein [Rossellomorea aquimaris]WJV32151.1 hypothetical protein QTG56_22535 [Rossellomorea sp. AcN35-11]